MLTLDQLAEIPTLAREAMTALASQGRSNAGPRSGRPAPGEPINLALLSLDRATQPPTVADPIGQDPDSHLLWELYEAVRVVTDEADEAAWEVPAQPVPVWDELCGWLTATADFWTGQRLSCEWVSSNVAHVHAVLSRYAGVPREPILICRHLGDNGDECGARLTDRVSYLECAHGHTISRTAALREAAGAQWLPLAEALAAVEEHYGLSLVPPLKTVRQWGHRGHLDDIRRRDSRGWWIYHVAGLWQACAIRMLDGERKGA